MKTPRISLFFLLGATGVAGGVIGLLIDHSTKRLFGSFVVLPMCLTLALVLRCYVEAALDYCMPRSTAYERPIGGWFKDAQLSRRSSQSKYKESGLVFDAETILIWALMIVVTVAALTILVLALAGQLPPFA